MDDFFLNVNLKDIILYCSLHREDGIQYVNQMQITERRFKNRLSEIQNKSDIIVKCTRIVYCRSTKTLPSTNVIQNFHDPVLNHTSPEADPARYKEGSKRW